MKKALAIVSLRRFLLVSVALFATAAFLVSVAAADEPSAQKSGQTVVKPLPAAPAPHAVAPAAKVQPKANVAAKPGQVGPTPSVAPSGSPKAAAQPLIPQAALPFWLQKSAESTEVPLTEKDRDRSAIVKKIGALIDSPKFTFLPDKGLDPFVPFVTPQAPANAPGIAGPLTPLQRMTLAEMERGLKAIVWGDMGRMAVIEDSTGKGFIVGVGTPAGPNAGVITQIQQDRLVIRQQVWNSKTRKRAAENFSIKLIKAKNNGQL